MTSQQEKQLQIAESINNTASQVIKLVQEFHINSYKGKRLKGNSYRKQRRLIKKKQKKESSVTSLKQNKLARKFLSMAGMQLSKGMKKDFM